ncbi:MAG: zinc-dependent peptidase [Flavobacteriaceae bacterium]
MAEEESYITLLFIGAMTIGLALFVGVLFLKLIDLLYLNVFKRPAWVHFYLRKKQLNDQQKYVLRHNFKFYENLSLKNKKRFEHRLVCFMEDKEFIAREGFQFTEDKKLLISATAVMLTFGMRKYLLPIIARILVYPEEFYSTTDDRYHKGEFNPKLKTLVLSWKDFEEGFRIDDDNLNLGIHEFTHAIHFNSMQRGDTASVVFSDGFSELISLLRSDLSNGKLQNSGFIREYAFTNEFEFLAVVVENFIESPKEFKRQFPKLYKKIQQMFNFRFAGY